MHNSKQRLEGPIMISRETAIALGLDKAAIIDYIHKFLEPQNMDGSGTFIGGYFWMANEGEWSGLEFISDYDREEAIHELGDDGILLIMPVPASDTVLYSIDYDELTKKLQESE